MSQSCLLGVHSFGAVLEEFEVQDALDNVLALKDTTMPMIEQSFSAQTMKIEQVSPRQPPRHIRAH